MHGKSCWLTEVLAMPNGHHVNGVELSNAYERYTNLLASVHVA